MAVGRFNGLEDRLHDGWVGVECRLRETVGGSLRRAWPDPCSRFAQLLEAEGGCCCLQPSAVARALRVTARPAWVPTASHALRTRHQRLPPPLP